MSRKDFEAIAKIMHEKRQTERHRFDHHYTDEPVHLAVDVISKNLADYLATTNQNFDRERFLTACGVGLGK